MLLLIDAYNLMHHSDTMQRGRGEGWLRRARDRLIDRLAVSLGPELAKQTCLVFDSRASHRHLPNTVVIGLMEIRFAVDHEEADDLIEEIIARHPVPKRLMVVSSDHRIQKAASRRDAKFRDSDSWYAELVDKGPALAVPWPPKNGRKQEKETPDKPESPIDQAERDAWLQEFANVAANSNDAFKSPEVSYRSLRKRSMPKITEPKPLTERATPQPSNSKTKRLAKAPRTKSLSRSSLALQECHSLTISLEGVRSVSMWPLTTRYLTVQ